MWENQVQSLGQEHPLKKEMATHSSILAWKISWVEEPGRLHSVHGVAELDTTEATSLHFSRLLGKVTYLLMCLSAVHSLFCDVFHPFLFSCRSVGVLLILDQGSVTTACWPNPDLHQCLQMVLLGHLCSMLSSRKGNCVAVWDCKVPNTIWSSTMHSSTLDSAARCLNCKVDYFTFHT